MITEFLIYDLKVAVLIAAFYFCYRLLMERDTMHRLNRVVLLAGLALSLLLPLCVITFHKTAWIEMDTTVSASTGAGVAPAVAAQPVSSFWETIGWQHLIATIVVIGMLVRLYYVVMSYRQLKRLVGSSECHQLDDGICLAVADEPMAPFSWMQTVVMGRKDYEEHNPLLLIHERSHIRLHHSWDVIFVELLTVLQWFNPVVWLLSRDLRTVHEYEADEAVLSQGCNTAQYISLLMTKATGIQACVLANGINTSETKKRIDMMIKRKSPRLSWLKGLYVVPIAALSLAVTANTVTDYRTLPTTEEVAATMQAKPFALHAVVDQNGRITGFTHEGEPDPRQPLVYPVGYIFIDGREATAEEVMNYRTLDIEAFEMVHNPNSNGDPKWNYKDKQGILAFRTNKVDANPADGPVFEVVEKMPEYPGGEGPMMEFLMRTVKYPKVAEENGVQGRVLLQFIVEKDGSLSNISARKVTDSSGNDIVVIAYKPEMTDEQRQNVDKQNEGLQALKDEGVRVVTLMPKWTPGKQRGQNVRVRYTIPVTFRLQ